MAKLKALIDKLDDVPEAYRDLYAKRADGKFALDMEGAELADDVAGLKRALAEEREAIKTLRADAQKFKDIDPAKYREMMAEAEQRQRDKAKAEGDFETLQAQLEAKHAEVVANKDSRIQTLTNALHERLVDAEAISAIAAAKGRAKLLLPAIKPHIKVVESEGKFAVQVLDGNGRPMISKRPGNNDPMSIAEFVESLKADGDFAAAFDGSGASGSGAGGAGSGSGGVNGVRRISRADVSGHIEAIAKGEAVVSD